MSTIKTYSKLLTFPTFRERLLYLQTNSCVGEDTFGSKRYLNQWLYHNSSKWRSIRSKVIIRDDGCDLALPGYPIYGTIFVHHITPLTEEDILGETDLLFGMDNLVCVSFETHNAIHYGTLDLMPPVVTERTKNDTCLW